MREPEAEDHTQTSSLHVALQTSLVMGHPKRRSLQRVY